MDKYEIIDKLIVNVNKLADAHGAAKCMNIIETIQQLADLKQLIQAEDEERGRAE